MLWYAIGSLVCLVLMCVAVAAHRSAWLIVALGLMGIAGIWRWDASVSANNNHVQAAQELRYAAGRNGYVWESGTNTFHLVVNWQPNDVGLSVAETACGKSIYYRKLTRPDDFFFAPIDEMVRQGKNPCPKCQRLLKPFVDLKQPDKTCN